MKIMGEWLNYGNYGNDSRICWMVIHSDVYIVDLQDTGNYCDITVYDYYVLLTLSLVQLS